MESFKINGFFYQKDDTQVVSDKFKKREFIVEIANEKNSEWNDFVKFQLTNDKCTSIDTTAIGSQVTVHFNLQGRKWEKDGKVNFFNTLSAWKIEVEQVANGQQTTENAQTSNQPVDEEGDDLPF